MGGPNRKAGTTYLLGRVPTPTPPSANQRPPRGGFFASPEMPVIVRQHWGQHEGCDPCKWQSLTFNNGQPKTHVKKGDPWKDNPVAERIEEQKAAGKRVAAFELKNPAASQGSE